MIKGLVRLASNLDARGYAKEAGMLDSVIQKMAQVEEAEEEAKQECFYSTKQREMLVALESKYPNRATDPAQAKGYTEEHRKIIPEQCEEAAPTPSRRSLTPYSDPQNKTDDLWSATSAREPNIVKRGGW